MKNGDWSGREEPERRKPGYNNEERVRAGMLLKGESVEERGKNEVVDNFCRRKFCEQNFMQARGSREAADNFCRKK